jgi:hypothetical protein
MSPPSAKKRKQSDSADEEDMVHRNDVDSNKTPEAHDTITTQEAEEAERCKEGCEWRDQPPYRTHANNHTFDKKHTGHCNCGRIKYWLSRETPLASKYCHCKDCQSLHGKFAFDARKAGRCLCTRKLMVRTGAPFQWAAIFEKGDLHFENGAQGLAFYQSGNKHTHHDLPCKVSCAHCHAPIMDEGRNMVLMFPALIKFKDEEAKKGFEPT